MINANTIPTYLIGHPISHSQSPVFQNPAFQHLGINSVYLALDIQQNDFDSVISALKKMQIMGLNITLPYKKDIIEFTDSLSQEAKIIKAVNTIEIKDKKWIGHNTDWYGVYKTLEEKKIANNQNVLIIGAGGATPGVIYGLKKYGIQNIAITNRTSVKAKRLQEQFSIKLVLYKDFYKSLSDYTMIINCTTINFVELLDDFDNNTIYFDIKYYTKPLNIKKYIDGSDMLLYQGAKSFSIWTKKTAPIDIMRDAFKLSAK